MADYEVVADQVWHSGEGKYYKKGEIISLAEGIKCTAESSIKPVVPEPEEKRRGRPPKSE